MSIHSPACSTACHQRGGLCLAVELQQADRSSLSLQSHTQPMNSSNGSGLAIPYPCARPQAFPASQSSSAAVSTPSAMTDRPSARHGRMGERSQFLEMLQGQFRLIPQGALGDFEAKPVGRQLGFVEQAFHPADQVAVQQIERGQVGRDDCRDAVLPPAPLRWRCDLAWGRRAKRVRAPAGHLAQQQCPRPCSWIGGQGSVP